MVDSDSMTGSHAFQPIFLSIFFCQMCCKLMEFFSLSLLHRTGNQPGEELSQLLLVVICHARMVTRECGGSKGYASQVFVKQSKGYCLSLIGLIRWETRRIRLNEIYLRLIILILILNAGGLNDPSELA